MYRNRTVVELARGVRAFLSLEVGLSRGATPSSPDRRLEQAEARIRKQTRQLGRLRERLSGNNRELPPRAADGDHADGKRRRHRNGLHDIRRDVALRYLNSSGLEVGALHQPLEVPSGVTVRYVDRMTVDQLREHYPELAAYDLVPVDIVDDGETLLSVADDSVDFVIANHMMEHCQNPIGTIENHLRVLRPGGVLYMSVPDKRFTFDHHRPVTSLEHLVRDYTEGPAWSVGSHFEDWARLMDKVPEDRVAERASQLAEIDFSIHFHVWTQAEFLELLLYCRRELGFPFEIEVLQKNDIEFISVLRKQPEG